MGELGPAGFWATQVLTLGIFASALLHPFCIVGTLLLWVLTPTLSADMPMIWLGGLNLLVFVLGYGVSIAAGHRALRKLGITGWIFPLATMPIYWVLMSAAAWMALWQFMVAPFHWDKTEHGLSHFQKRRRSR